MPELKNLQDFYDPTKTLMAGMQYVQGQQHLALQQQQVEQQGKNLEIDNLQKAYSASNPMESYPIAAQLMQKLGLPVPDVNKYYANTSLYDKLLNAEPGTPQHDAAMAVWMHTDPRSRAVVEKEVGSNRAFLGAQELNVAAGGGGSENLAALTEQKPAIQTQMAQVVAQTPKDREEAQALAIKRTEHEALVAKLKPEMDVLATLTKVTARGIENVTPLIQQMQPIEEKYLKDQKRLGLAGARSARDEAIAINPSLAAFHDKRVQEAQSLQSGLDALHQKEDALTLHLQKIGLGTEALKEGESLAKLQGDIGAIGHQIDFTKTRLAMMQAPTPANLKAVETMKANMEARLKTLETTKVQSEEGLAIRRGALNEKILEYRDKQTLLGATNEAQTRFASLPANRQHTQAAAAIARAVEKETGVKVAPEDIMKGKEKREPGETMTADQSANLVIKTLAQAAGDAGAADVIDPVTGAVDFGRLIHKSARDQQAFIDSIRTKSKLKEFAGVKDSLEIVARDAEAKMATTKTAQKSVTDAKEQLPAIDSKEIQDALSTGKPFVYEKGGHKFKLEGKGKSQQWVVVE
jgi:hypothetical protein